MRPNKQTGWAPRDPEPQPDHGRDWFATFVMAGFFVVLLALAGTALANELLRNRP